MKPYIYILAVLLVGGSIGFYLGQRTAGPAPQLSSGPEPNSLDNHQAIQGILDRQREAYRLHDALLMLRDCSSSYVEVNSATGEVYSFHKALTRYHEVFSPGKSIQLAFRNQEINVTQNTAVVRSNYSKTSDQFEQQGFQGLAGQGLWMMAKTGGRWEIVAFSWTEDRKL